MDTAKLPSTRKEAQRHGLPYYFTGVPCKHGHVAPRETKGNCVECRKFETKMSAEKRAAYFKAWNASERGKEIKRAYYERNKELVIARAEEQDAEKKRAYRKKWKQANPDDARTSCSMYKRRVREHMPKWLTKEQRLEIRKLYMMAVELTRTTGVRYTVDHIVPVRSDVVCGLHVPWNLQILQHSENAKKGNKLHK